MAKLQVKKAVLVYQGGLANVFEVSNFDMSGETRRAKRLSQQDFRACEMFALGLAVAGVEIAVAWCNQAGDIADASWQDDNFDRAPFNDKFWPVISKDGNVIRDRAMTIGL